jgi:hypothetical protein
MDSLWKELKMPVLFPGDNLNKNWIVRDQGQYWQIHEQNVDFKVLNWRIFFIDHL